MSRRAVEKASRNGKGFVAESPLARVGLREQVSHRILTGVFEGRFISDEHLVVSRLSKMFGVSPTPVRESLVELAGLGIVELLPNRGAVVKQFGPEQLREMSHVRRVLEVEAARCACGRLPKQELAGLNRELGELEKLPASETRDVRARTADTQLHACIARHCGNPRLAAEAEDYLLLFRALRNVSHLRDSWNAYRRSNDVPEHLKIVKALIGGNKEKAAQAMDQHIRSVERTLEEVPFSSR